MGCDGGTIPKRKEVVKKKSDTNRRERKKQLEQADRWSWCPISQRFLNKSIVASPYGYLMSKEGALTHLLEWRRDQLSAYHRIEDFPDILGPVHTMKDIKDLKFKENPNKSNNDQASTSAGDSSIVGNFVCPITGLETNGQYTFMFPWKCGCVVSERAIKEVPNDNKCLVCQKPYKEHELVQINPRNSKELKLNQAKFMCRKMERVLTGKPDESTDTSGSSSQESKSSTASSGNGNEPTASTSHSTNSNASSSSSKREEMRKRKRDLSKGRESSKRTQQQ